MKSVILSLLFFNYSTWVKVKVKDIMTPNPIVVSGTSTIAHIEEIFAKNHIWSIYIGEKNNFVGIITRNDLKFRLKNKNKSAPAYSIMSKGVINIDENADVEDAKALLYQRKINGLAVTRNGKHCGIITRYDIKNKHPTFTNIPSNIPPLIPASSLTYSEPQPSIDPVSERSSQPMTMTQRISYLIKTSPKDRKIQEAIEKIKGKEIAVEKIIDQKLIEIKALERNIESIKDKAKKSRSNPEKFFFGNEIKHKQSILKSKWDTLDKLQKIQHYYDHVVTIGDLSVSLKDFGLEEFSEEEIEQFIIDTKIKSQEKDGKIKLINVVSSPSLNYDTDDEDLKDILAEIGFIKK